MGAEVSKKRNLLHRLAAFSKRSVKIMRHRGLGNFLRMTATQIMQPKMVRYEFGQAGYAEEAIDRSPAVGAVAKDQLRFGVNLAGFFTGQFGIAASSRAFAYALRLGGVSHVLNRVVAEAHGEKRKTSLEFSTSTPYAINLVHLNADLAEHLFSSMGPAYSKRKYNIGIWYWELARFPASLSSAFRYYDEIWTTSSFTNDCLSKVSPIPVIKVRYPLAIDERLIDGGARKRFGLPQGTCAFLFYFDFASVFERKNPLALLRAFKRAFRRDEKVLLVFDCINGWANPDAADLVKKTSFNMNVKILNRHLSEADYFSLLAACDCYVSLHRSEGLGLTLAEAMYLGKPVIATAYSGNMDFTNSNNSLLVKYKLVELDSDHGPYEKGNVWAEPDIDHAAGLMRWVHDNREEAARMGQRASAEIKHYMNPKTASEDIEARLEYAYGRVAHRGQ